MQPRFCGIIPPVLTPLIDWKSLDCAGLERLIERMVEGGVHGLFLLGTSGEGASLDGTMRREIIDRVTRQVNRRTTILVSVTDTSFIETIKLADYATEKGCDALVVAPPYYHPIGQENLCRYFDRLATMITIPTLLYNIPSHTKTIIEPKTVQEAMQNPVFVGIKDSSGDMGYFRQLTQLPPRDDWSFLVGPESLLIESMKCGGHGGICGGANLLPRLFVKIYESVKTENWNEVERLQQRLTQLQSLYRGFPEASFLRNIKGAAAVLGICAGEFAEPLHALPPHRIKQLGTMLTGLGITAQTLE